VAGEEGREAALSEAPRIGGARVALEEREGDRRIDVSEDGPGSRPGARELGPELVGEPDPGGDQVLPRPGEDAQGARLVAVALEGAEAVVVGARELGEHEGVEAVRLAAACAVARPRRLHLVGVQGVDAQAGRDEALDQHPVRALDRDAVDPQAAEQLAELPQAGLVMGDGALVEQLALVGQHAHRVLLARPVDPRADHRHDVLLTLGSSHAADREVPLRVLIEGCSQARRPVAASGTSHRREALVSSGPSQRQARSALSRRWSASRPYRPALRSSTDHSALRTRETGRARRKVEQ